MNDSEEKFLKENFKAGEFATLTIMVRLDDMDKFIEHLRKANLNLAICLTLRLESTLPPIKEMEVSNDELFLKLAEIAAALEWNVAIPQGDDEEEVKGLVIGTQEYIDSVLNGTFNCKHNCKPK